MMDIYCITSHNNRYLDKIHLTFNIPQLFFPVQFSFVVLFILHILFILHSIVSFSFFFFKKTRALRMFVKTGPELQGPQWKLVTFSSHYPEMVPGAVNLVEKSRPTSRGEHLGVSGKMRTPSGVCLRIFRWTCPEDIHFWATSAFILWIPFIGNSFQLLSFVM